jgi:hypothetical protein
MYRKIVVLKTVGLNKVAEENKGQFWWERGKPVKDA